MRLFNEIHLGNLRGDIFGGVTAAVVLGILFADEPKQLRRALVFSATFEVLDESPEKGLLMCHDLRGATDRSVGRDE